jgi:hypothetical protein
VDIHQCQCPHCRPDAEHPDRVLHQRLNLLLSRLDEQQRRWLVALESQKVGRGGDRLLSLITGLNVETIRRGRRELDASLQDCPSGRIRRPGAGRPAVKKKTPPCSAPCASWSRSKRPGARPAAASGSALASPV